MTRWLMLILMVALTAPLGAFAQGEEGGDAETEEAPKTKGDGDASDEEAPKTKGDGESDADRAAREAEEAAAAAEEAAAAEAAAEEEAAAAAAAAAEAEAAAAAEADAAAAAEAAAAEAEKKKLKPSLVAEAGVVWLSGNTASITANGAIHFGLSGGRHAFALDFGGNYGRAVVDTNGDGKTEVGTDEWATSATRVFGKARYDLSIVPDVNSIYVSAGGFHDPFAGYVYRLRGDVGYGHKVVNTDVHKLRAEAGFNYTREFLVDDPTVTADDLPSVRTNNFFGARLFAGYTLTPNDAFGFYLNVETLIGGADNVDGVFDGRLLMDTGITANLSKIFSIKIGFAMDFDYVPPDVDGIDGPDIKAIDTTTSFTIVATLF